MAPLRHETRFYNIYMPLLLTIVGMVVSVASMYGVWLMQRLVDSTDKLNQEFTKFSTAYSYDKQINEKDHENFERKLTDIAKLSK